MPLGNFKDWDECKSAGKSDEYCGWLKAHASPDAKEVKNDGLLFEGRIYLPTEKATKSSLEFNGKNYEYSKDATEAYYDYEKFKAIEKIYSAPKEQVLDYIKNNPGKSGEDIGKVLTGYDIMKAKDSDEIQMPLDKLEREGKIIYRENGWYIKESTESNSLQSPRGKEDPEINSLQTPMGDEAVSEEDLQLATNDEFPEHVKDEMAIKTEEGKLTTWADPNSEMNKKRHEQNIEDEKIEFDGESYVISPRGYIAKENDLEFNGRVYVKENTWESRPFRIREIKTGKILPLKYENKADADKYIEGLKDGYKNDFEIITEATLQSYWGGWYDPKATKGKYKKMEPDEKYNKEIGDKLDSISKEGYTITKTKEIGGTPSYLGGTNSTKVSLSYNSDNRNDVTLKIGDKEEKFTDYDKARDKYESLEAISNELREPKDDQEKEEWRKNLTSSLPHQVSLLSSKNQQKLWSKFGGIKDINSMSYEDASKLWSMVADSQLEQGSESNINEIQYGNETYYLASPKHDTLDTDLIFENRIYTKIPQVLDYNGESFYITDKKQGTESDLELDGRIYSKEFNTNELIDSHIKAHYETNDGEGEDKKKDDDEETCRFCGKNIHVDNLGDHYQKFHNGNTAKEYDPVQVAAGTKIEMEHTKDEKKAEQIAKDHLDEVPNYYDKLIPAEKKWKNAKETSQRHAYIADINGDGQCRKCGYEKDDIIHIATEEGSAPTVAGPPSDSNMVARSKKVLVEPKKYIQSESIIIKTDKGYVGVPVFEAMGDNKCSFCDGAGEVIVEDLGLKECPRCEGNGQEPEGAPMNQQQDPLNQVQQNPQIDQNQNPSITGSTVPQPPLQQQGSMNKNEPLDPTKTALPLGSDPKTGGQQPFNQPQQQLGQNPQQPPNNPNQSHPQHQLQQNPVQQHQDPNQHEQPQMNQQQEQPEKKEFPPKDGEDKKKEFPPKKKSGESEKRWIKGQDGQWHEIDESDRDYKFGQKEKGEETVCPNMIKYKDFIRGQIRILESKSKANESVGLLYDQNIRVVNESNKGLHVEGTLAYAGQSLNKRIYLGEELAKGDGMTVPLLLNHSSTAGAEAEFHRLNETMKQHLLNGKDYRVGEVTLKWHPEKLTLTYEGYITDPFFQKEITEANMAVSLGMYYDSSSPRYCGTADCYTIIRGAEFREVSLVYHPGFPIATIQAVEAEIRKAIEVEKQKALEHIEPITTPTSITITSTGTLNPNGTYNWTTGNTASTTNFTFN